MIIQKPRIPVKEVLLYAFLPGFIKKLIYKLKGYRIGKEVSIGFGSIICGRNVYIGDHTSIGFFTIIRGEEIKIGSHVSSDALPPIKLVGAVSVKKFLSSFRVFSWFSKIIVVTARL